MLVEADFADDAYFVSLATLQRPEDVPAAVVKTLAIIALSGEPLSPGGRALPGCQASAAGRRQPRHVLGAVPFIGRLLSACPWGSRCWPRVGSGSACRLSATPRRRWPCRSRTRRRGCGRAGRARMSRCSARERASATLTSTWTTATRRLWRRSAGASTDGPWPSSWRRPLRVCHPPRSPTAWASGPRCATRPRASTRSCARDHRPERPAAHRPREAARRAFAVRGRRHVEAAEVVTHARLDTLDDLAAKSLLNPAPSTRGRPRDWRCSKPSAAMPASASAPPPT